MLTLLEQDTVYLQECPDQPAGQTCLQIFKAHLSEPALPAEADAAAALHIQNVVKISGHSSCSALPLP